MGSAAEYWKEVRRRLVWPLLAWCTVAWVAWGIWLQANPIYVLVPGTAPVFAVVMRQYLSRVAVLAAVDFAGIALFVSLWFRFSANQHWRLEDVWPHGRRAKKGR